MLAQTKMIKSLDVRPKISSLHFTGKGFDPALVAETQKNAAYFPTMIKHVAPLHFAGLEAQAKA